MPLALLVFALAAAAVWRWRSCRVGRREAVRTETLALAAKAQTWWRSPRWLGGADHAPHFQGLSLDALGLAADATDRYWTDAGVYRVLPVPASRALAEVAAAIGEEAPTGAALVLGCERGRPSREAVAVLALGGLVTVPLPEVPWRWVAWLVRWSAQLSRPAPRVRRRVAHPRRAVRRSVVPRTRPRLRGGVFALPMSGRAPPRPPPSLVSGLPPPGAFALTIRGCATTSREVTATAAVETEPTVRACTRPFPAPRDAPLRFPPPRR